GGVVRAVPVRIRAGGRAPFAHPGAPVGKRGEAFAFDLELGGIRAAAADPAILVVPVGNEHDQDLEAAQLFRAGEGTAVPAPVAVFEELETGVAELEAGG